MDKTSIVISGFPERTVCSSVIRDFTIGRRDGSENVALKTNLRSFGLYRDYSSSHTLSNVGERCRSSIFRNIFKFRKRIKFRRRLFTSSIKSEIRQFHVVVVQKRQRNVSKSAMHVQSCCFAYRTPIVVFDVLVAVASWDGKVPIAEGGARLKILKMTP